MDHEGSRRKLPKLPKKKQKARRKSTRNHKQPRNITASSGKDQTLSRRHKIPSNNINDRALSSNNRILSGNNRILISNNKVLFSNSSNSSTSKSNPHMLILTTCPE